MNDRSDFYTKLEESVLKEGVRNPILVSAGWCPQYKIDFMPLDMQEDINQVLICDRHGGSRLWAAQKNGLQIPCIVSDYVNRFPKAEALEGEEQVRLKFTDQPKKIKINDHGVHVGSLPHIHLDEEG